MPDTLPLVTFEQYMLADDTPEYPRTFVLEVTLSGELRRAALEAAWPLALTRHPLLVARLDAAERNWIWQGNQSAPSIDWGSADEPLTFAVGEAIDLKSEPGVRLWVRSDADHVRLTLQFHHACCDGIGCFEFVGDFLALYAHEVDPEAAPVLPSVRPELLARRGTFGLSKPTPWEFLRDVAVTIAMSVRHLARKPVAVAPPRSALKAPQRFPGIESHTFSPDEMAALRRSAAGGGASLNDLLMAHLFAAIVDWNGRDQPVPRRQWLRMNVPTSLRLPADEEMPAANVMSFAFIDRRAGDCTNAAVLTDSIRTEMEAIRRLRLSLYFIGQMGVVAAIPGALRAMMRRRRCFASAVLTNLGDATRRFRVRFRRRDNRAIVGNLLLEKMVGVPPLRALTHVGVGVFVYAGQMTIGMLCDRHHFDAEQARQFLASYVARITAGLSAGELRPAASDVDRGAAVDH